MTYFLQLSRPRRLVKPPPSGAPREIRIKIKIKIRIRKGALRRSCSAARTGRPSRRQQQTDRQRAAGGMGGKEQQGGGGDGRTAAVAGADGRFVDAGVLAFGFAHVHGIKQGGIINQAEGQSQNRLGNDQHPEARRQQHGAETKDHHGKSAGQETKPVVPLRPKPQQDEGPRAGEKPDGADHAGQRFTETEWPARVGMVAIIVLMAR